MTGWNMPPGCNESDIPGNRPEDLKHEALCDKIANAICQALNVEELIDVRVTQDQWEDFIVKMSEVCDDVYDEGYAQGKDDTDMELGVKIHELEIQLAKLKDNAMDRLTRHELEILCWAINHFGSGDHPFATWESVKYFVKDYAIECLKKSLTNCRVPGDVRMIIEKLEGE